ncbi:hypothetical protein A3D03_01335 [Candidatus Gottesmanbacteria bacterium RIFCSPHIGHO2_02_FULL_40_13]|uniref:SCP domain-containing protein n=1 Tax=Candidatus Gottesmanbacteria bacterium RIFCSPHIGHO2_02_FULL_40_13 TaxID=1798384 RepID=A0A1F6ABI3_9BACT|nr:MAG: hypothetical protein A3D03_01335 [Candidatus Gottesmanbacteria bacterium RIFCSPHIGHO2_02_FULL_40_13]
MIRKIKLKKRKNKRKKILAICLIIFFSFNIYSVKIKSLSKPSPLPIPHLAQIYLPDLLIIPGLETSVLGAQIIDPMDFIYYINTERSKVGSSKLRVNEKLMKAAQMRAETILKYQNFSHLDPYENLVLATVLPKVGYLFTYATENIGMGGVSAEDFVGGFMHSTMHKENLLSPTLSDTGAAVVTGPYKQYYVNIIVQLFAIPGGKDEYLGYSKKEKEKYKKLLADIGFQLHPINWTINSVLYPEDYSLLRKNKLEKQKRLLTEIYRQMKDDQPLTYQNVAMIMEFNKTMN